MSRTSHYGVILALGGALCAVPEGAEARNSLVEAIPAMTEAERAALQVAKIKDTRRLYQKTYKGQDQRAELAKATGLTSQRIDWLASVADLCRLYKLPPRTAHLMTLADVDGLKALAGRQASALRARIQDINDTLRLTENLPTEREVAGFIKDAAVLRAKDWEQTRRWASVR